MDGKAKGKANREFLAREVGNALGRMGIASMSAWQELTYRYSGDAFSAAWTGYEVGKDAYINFISGKST